MSETVRKRIEVHDSKTLEQALSHVRRERVTLNFSWLLKLRWAAVLGQLFTVVVVHYGIGVDVRRAEILGIISIAAVTNLFLVWWFARNTRDGGVGNLETSGEFMIGSIMTLDMFLLTGLLYVTGGPSNPFTIFYLVNCILAGVVLRPMWGWILGILACLCYAALFISPVRVEAMIGGVESADVQYAWRVHLVGMFVAFATAAGITLYFFTRVFVELARLEQELLVMRQRYHKGQRLEAMATLAAGAAHELSSPLSTIAVVAKELEREASAPGVAETMLEDTRLIREEVNRCRRILDRMSADAGESAGEALVLVTPTEVFDDILGEVSECERVRVHVADEVAALRFRLPRVALSQALRGLVQNALDASSDHQAVDLEAELRQPRAARPPMLSLLVRDAGAGMEASTLERIGTPFFTTKDVGSGTGLGIFLARTVVERLGGQLWIESTPGKGTLVSVELPADEALRESAAIPAYSQEGAEGAESQAPSAGASDSDRPVGDRTSGGDAPNGDASGDRTDRQTD